MRPILCCDRVPQTLTHMFVTCRIARSAWLWVSDVWHQLTSHRPQLLASVLLADAVRVGRPAAAQRLLWTRVRQGHAACSLFCRSPGAHAWGAGDVQESGHQGHHCVPVHDGQALAASGHDCIGSHQGSAVAGGPGPCHHCRDVHGMVVLQERALPSGGPGGNMEQRSM